MTFSDSTRLTRQLVHREAGQVDDHDGSGQAGGDLGPGAVRVVQDEPDAAARSVAVSGPVLSMAASSLRARGSSGVRATGPTWVPSFQISGRDRSWVQGSRTTSPWFQARVR